MKIYTKFGDRGETRLFDGTRVPKYNPRVEAYGSIDELNAALGVVVAFGTDPEIRPLLISIQKQLFALGAELADPKFESRKSDKGRLAPDWVSAIEAAIDGYTEQLPPLRKFILSGGGPAGALLHMARTVCRRAERDVVRLARETAVDPKAIEYLNRLSDFLFVLARVVNHREKREEIEW